MGLKKIKLIGATPLFEAELKKALIALRQSGKGESHAYYLGKKFREAFKKATEDEKCV